MAGFDFEKMAQNVAEKALDCLYMGKTLKEWITEIKEERKPTNGEMIKALFNPTSEEETENFYIVEFEKGFYATFLTEWWSAPYKREGAKE